MRIDLRTPQILVFYKGSSTRRSSCQRLGHVNGTLSCAGPEERQRTLNWIVFST